MHKFCLLRAWILKLILMILSFVMKLAKDEPSSSRNICNEVAPSLILDIGNRYHLSFILLSLSFFKLEGNGGDDRGIYIYYIYILILTLSEQGWMKRTEAQLLNSSSCG